MTVVEWGLPATAWSNQTVRELERASIRAFVESCADHLTGRVLDFGCGQQPYRDVVEQAGGEYVPYDRAAFPANVSGADVGDEPVNGDFDAVLCNQVAQYWPHPLDTLWRLRSKVFVHGERAPGVLVMTFPTNWDEVEAADLFRYTATGMTHLLRQAGWKVERMERRAEITLGGFRFPLGYGVVARA